MGERAAASVIRKARSFIFFFKQLTGITPHQLRLRTGYISRLALENLYLIIVGSVEHLKSMVKLQSQKQKMFSLESQ